MACLILRTAEFKRANPVACLPMADVLDSAAVCPAPSFHDFLLYPISSIPTSLSVSAGTFSILSFLSSSFLWSLSSAIYSFSFPSVRLPSVSFVARICDLLTFFSVAITCVRMYDSPPVLFLRLFQFLFILIPCHETDEDVLCLYYYVSQL